MPVYNDAYGKPGAAIWRGTPTGVSDGGVNYGDGTGNSAIDKLLPFNKNASAWWKPGESEFLFGGGATKGMPTAPATGEYQTGYLKDMLGRGPVNQDTTMSGQARGQQQGLADMLMRQASGQQQGAGELAVQRQANNAMANQIGAAQMSRGANAALAARTAARTNADIGVNAAGQAGIAQMQDQQGAMNQLGGLLGTMRGQDVQVAGANQQAGLGQQQLQLGALAQMLGVDQASLQQELEKRKIDAGDKGAAGSIITGLGTMMAMSDRNNKTDIVEDAGPFVDYVLDNLTPKAYMYKDEKYAGAAGNNPRLGIMAQDLRELGENITVETPEGLQLDANAALSFALAAVARLNQRINELEAR